MTLSCVRSVIQEVVSGVQRPAGFRQLWNTRWTANHNGVNSVILVTPVKTTDYIVTGEARDYGTGQLVDINTVVDFSIGEIGKKGDAHFKGQISNIKVIVNDGSEKSRFYPGVIYSYVDPDAADVPMPDSTVFVDDWCEPELVFETDFTNSDFTSDSGTLTYSSSGARYKGSTNDVAYLRGNFSEGVYKFEVVTSEAVEDSTPSSSPRFQMKGSGNYVASYANRSPNKLITVYQYNPINTDTFYMELGGYKIGGEYTLKYLKVTKVTHGILTNFGADQPYVPLLGDREEHNSPYNSGACIRGIAYNSFMTSRDTPKGFGSYGHGGRKLPEQSIVVNNGQRMVITSNRSGSTSPHIEALTGDKEQIHHAFQYPQSFKVIKPTDPDYGDYL